MLRKALSTFFCAALIAFPAVAHEYELGELYIDHPWARPLPPVVPSGAAYLRIQNRGAGTHTLLAARSPIADKVEVHEHVHVDGLMKMQQVERLTIPAGETVTFAPGGYHLMMFGLKQPLVAGERFPVTLVFEEAGSIEVEVMIGDAPAAPVTQEAPVVEPEADQHHHH
ncbi:copper chaperone PCu(A)C [Halopseudomonas sp.]|uniref:copper chaperone PCu(A)C n=1 Tax=Halopseudomonas sp. TaxID=2901191 RepID=UPI00300246D3